MFPSIPLTPLIAFSTVFTCAHRPSMPSATFRRSSSAMSCLMSSITCWRDASDMPTWLARAPRRTCTASIGPLASALAVDLSQASALNPVTGHAAEPVQACRSTSAVDAKGCIKGAIAEWHCWPLCRSRAWWVPSQAAPTAATVRISCARMRRRARQASSHGVLACMGRCRDDPNNGCATAMSMTKSFIARRLTRGRSPAR